VSNTQHLKKLRHTEMLHHAGTLRRRSAGLTLVELIMSITVMSIIGLGITGMLSAVTRGTESGQDLRQATIDHTRLGARLGAAIREAQAVVMADTSGMILWLFDTNADGDADLDELEMITWSEDEQALIAYRVDPLVPSTDLATDLLLDATGQLFGDLDETLVTAITDGDAEKVVWADSITGVEIDAHATQLSQANTVSYRVHMGVGDFTETAIGTVWLRNHTE